jgi:hypothetical protein
MSRPRLRIPAHIRERIGKTTDAVIARDLNCSIGFVQQYRYRNGIPAFGGRASSVEPAPVMVPPVVAAPNPLLQRIAQPAPAPVAVEAPVEEKPATLRGAAALHKALSAARPAKGGMVIPYDLFAALVGEVL